MTENKEVVAVKQETNVVATQDSMRAAGVSTGDLVIPKLLLMQSTSEYVGDGTAKMGDVVNSESREILAGIDKPLDIVPLKMFKTWRVYDLSSGQPKFLRQDPVTAANESQKWEGIENGIQVRRDLCMNFFVLNANEANEGMAFPYVITFKRTSISAGKSLATHIFKMAMFGKNTYEQAIQLKVVRQKKETNTYAVFEIGKPSQISDAAKKAAQDWIKMLTTANVVVKDESEEQTEVKPVVSSPVREDDSMEF